MSPTIWRDWSPTQQGELICTIRHTRATMAEIMPDNLSQPNQPSRFIAFFDECGDHSLAKIDADFPIFVLALVIVEREAYRDAILPAFNKLKLRWFNHEGINLHSRDIRLSTGPFQLLRNPALRPQFLGDMSALVDGAPFTLFISAIQKQTHLERYGVNADNPYDLALEFTMERLIHFLHAEGETSLPIVAEARGRQEDNSLEKTFYRIIAQGTRFRPADEFHQLNLSLTFQPKVNNIAGVQLADLCAHPCARHIINPNKENRAFDVARRKVYERDGVSGWKVFP